MLNRKEKTEILEEMTYFEVSIAYKTGDIVTVEDEDYWKDENGNLYENSEVITARFNEDVKKRISKFNKPLLRMRQIKDLESINANDLEVKSLLKEIKLRNRQNIGKNTVTPEEEAAAIQTVIDKYEPQYQGAVLQLIIWALVRDDLFSKTSKGIDCRIQVDVPDDYWETKDEGIDELDDIILGTKLTPIVKKQSEPLEVMLAIVTTIVNENEEFALKMGELAGVVGGHLMASSKDYDDAGMFRRELAGFLPVYMVTNDNNSEWIDAGRRIFFNTEENRKQQGQEIKEESA